MANNNRKRGCFGCLGSIVLIFVFSLFVGAGKVAYGHTSVNTAILYGAIALVVIYFVFELISKNYTAANNAKKEARAQIGKRIAEKYNKEILEMKTAFDTATKIQNDYSYKLDLGSGYDEKYQALRTAFLEECQRDPDYSYNDQTKRLQNIWKTATVLAGIVIVCVFGFMIGLSSGPVEEISPLMQKADERTWNADQLPNVHIQDGSQYVINPDSILSEEVVDRMNKTLFRLDHELGIESAIVFVGHIEGGDAIPMVRGIYRRFGVGRDDRGLVIVVGYLDHTYFIATGPNLEADLTDSETDMLAERYLIPSMKAEQPDSGMLYLINGTYALMAQKDMPRMSALSSTSSDSNNDDDTPGVGTFVLFFALIVGWAGAVLKKSYAMGWMDNSSSFLVSNPFDIYRPSTDSYDSSSSSYRSSSSSSSSSSRSSGGSYGGGSWRGGGSGGRW